MMDSDTAPLLLLPPPKMQPGDLVMWATEKHHYFNRVRNGDRPPGRVIAVTYWVEDEPSVSVEFNGRRDICFMHQLRRIGVNP